MFVLALILATGLLLGTLGCSSSLRTAGRLRDQIIRIETVPASALITIGKDGKKKVMGRSPLTFTASYEIQLTAHQKELCRQGRLYSLDEQDSSAVPAMPGCIWGHVGEGVWILASRGYGQHNVLLKLEGDEWVEQRRDIPDFDDVASFQPGSLWIAGASIWHAESL